MEWSEINFEKAVWTIPADKMKGGKRQHLVPLTPQAIALLLELLPLTGGKQFAFPSARGANRCMSDGTINAALRRMGYSKEVVSGHGFRSSASTMLNESKLFHPDAIERQLAHVEGNAVRGAYDHAQHWDERVRLMAWWSDRCETLRKGGDVVDFPKAKRNG
jgi:integrase